MGLELGIRVGLEPWVRGGVGARGQGQGWSYVLGMGLSQD